MSYEAIGAWGGEDGFLGPIGENMTAIIASEEMAAEKLKDLLKQGSTEAQANLEAAKDEAATVFAKITDEMLCPREDYSLTQRKGQLATIYKGTTGVRNGYLKNRFRLTDEDAKPLNGQYLLQAFFETTVIEDVATIEAKAIIGGYYRADLDRNFNYIAGLHARNPNPQETPDKDISYYKSPYNKAPVIRAIGLLMLVGGYALKSKFKHHWAEGI